MLVLDYNDARIPLMSQELFPEQFYYRDTPNELVIHEVESSNLPLYDTRGMPFPGDDLNSLYLNSSKILICRTSPSVTSMLASN